MRKMKEVIFKIFNDIRQYFCMFMVNDNVTTHYHDEDKFSNFLKRLNEK